MTDGYQVAGSLWNPLLEGHPENKNQPVATLPQTQPTVQFPLPGHRGSVTIEPPRQLQLIVFPDGSVTIKPPPMPKKRPADPALAGLTTCVRPACPAVRLQESPRYLAMMKQKESPPSPLPMPPSPLPTPPAPRAAESHSMNLPPPPLPLPTPPQGESSRPRAPGHFVSWSFVRKIMYRVPAFF